MAAYKWSTHGPKDPGRHRCLIPAHCGSGRRAPPVPEPQESATAKALLPHFFATGRVGDRMWKDIDADAAFHVYRAWCRRHGLWPVERRVFEKCLRRQPGVTKKTRDGVVRWEGIHFRWPE